MKAVGRAGIEIKALTSSRSTGRAHQERLHGTARHE
jgi:hypothetical protein